MPDKPKPKPKLIPITEGDGRTGTTVTTGTGTGVAGDDDGDGKKDLTPAQKARRAQRRAEARADAKQKARDLKTANRYAQGAADFKWQIRAFKDAINNEFRRHRTQDIQDINLSLSQTLSQLQEGAKLRGETFLEGAADTEKATAGAQEEGFRNLVRERADTMTSILTQGAGETDAIRAMLVNARNWNENSRDASQAYFDTIHGINQTITDMNVDTKTGLSNAFMYAQGQREGIWNGFYEQRAAAMTRLADTYGTQSNLMDQATELGLKPNKKQAKLQATAKKGMKKYYAAGANELGKSYVQKPLPEWIDDYEGMAPIERRQSSTELASAPVYEGVQRAQGATLRKWAA